MNSYGFGFAIHFTCTVDHISASSTSRTLNFVSFERGNSRDSNDAKLCPDGVYRGELTIKTTFEELNELTKSDTLQNMLELNQRVQDAKMAEAGR